MPRALRTRTSRTRTSRTRPSGTGPSRVITSRAALVSVALAAVLSLAGGAVATAAPLGTPLAWARAGVASDSTSRHGHEQFHLTSKVATATRQQVRATGVLAARGHTVLGRRIGKRRVIWLVFGRGSVRLVIRLTSRSASPPNLTTCRFSESARGKYAIQGGKRKYAHAAGRGTYVTRIHGRLKRKNGRCTSTLRSYWQSTRTTGTMSW